MSYFQSKEVNHLRLQMESKWQSSRWLTKEESEQFCIRCAILLDPRFKTILEEDQVQEGFRKRVLAEMGKLRRPAPLDGHTQQTGMLRLSAVLKKRPRTVHVFLSNDEQELNQYLSHELLGEDEDPLEWWRHYEKAYPKLAQLAKNYLGCMATSAPVERA